MRVNKWGNHGWEFLHTTTFNYPIIPTNDDKENYRNLFTSLNYTLPCIYCQKSMIIYNETIKKYSYITIKYLCNLHHSLDNPNKCI